MWWFPSQPKYNVTPGSSTLILLLCIYSIDIHTFWYLMPINDVMKVWQISLQRMCSVACTLFWHPFNFCFAYVWTPCLMWKAWSTKHFKVLKSSGRLISKPSLITKVYWTHRVVCVIKKKRAWGIELASIATSKSSRIYRRVCYCLLCRCVASHKLWRSQKAT